MESTLNGKVKGKFVRERQSCKCEGNVNMPLYILSADYKKVFDNIGIAPLRILAKHYANPLRIII